MDKEKELPKRKHPRLDHYDYSSAGAYFVTICIKDRKRILSNIVKPTPVGVGAHDDPLTKEKTSPTDNENLSGQIICLKRIKFATQP